MAWWLILSPFLLVGGVILVLAILLGVDAVLRRFLMDAPFLNHVHFDVDNRELIVVIPGTITKGKTLVAQALEMLKEFGDVLIVETGTERFVESTIIDQVIHFISLQQEGEPHYKKVTIIGASIGGKVAYRIQRKVDRHKPYVNLPEVRVVYVDALLNASFLKVWAAKLSGYLPFGPIFNLFSRPVIKWPYVMPEWDELGEGHDRGLIEANLDAIFNMKLSVLSDQLRCLIDGRLPRANESEQLKAAYIRSGRDDAIKQPEALEAFQRAYGGNLEVFEVPESTHIGIFLEFPKTGHKALRDALLSLD